MKKTAIFLLLLTIILSAPNSLLSAQINTTRPGINDVIPVTALADAKMELVTPSAVLIEGSTGTIIFEKNKDERLRPASVTKIMTLLLIFEALEEGKINLMDDVSVTEHAASMGGSQVYLEPYEVQNVDTMIKCISIASANDASVAMAEHIAGSHEEFVARMNERAKELGMNNTNFVNCTGLDADNHYTTAYDIALMSRELITRFPQVSNYCTVWMDTFVHTTKKGRTEFGLTNTNKLIKSYKGITGLKTGSTSIAKYCLSATARRNNMDLIAVIMAAPDTKTRFMEAAKLLNYGFANYSVYVDDHKDITLEPVRVTKGISDYVYGKIKGEFSYLCSKGMSADNIRKEIVLYDKVTAPLTTEDKIGDIVYYYNNEKIGSVDILAKDNIEKAGYKDNFIKSIRKFFLTYK
ncbi:MAG TPA: D-alanyl-D-alanine carboxypeptidase [Clostridiales bacterium]|jgi:D-alanyl-D-alanine carboxypeptidase (penicillin-binding protein 5/6)|nr:D-alanyl-D-alanine carboxypeptidase [Clostridiales bacterium]